MKLKINKVKLLFEALKKRKIKKEYIFVAAFLILLPLTILGIYFGQKYLPKASEVGCQPIGMITNRESSAGTVIFETGCQIKGKISCSQTLEGQYVPCGEDDKSTNSHQIKTNASQPLQPNQGYYVKVNTGTFYQSLTYIYPGNDIDERGFTAENIYDYDNKVYGECQGDKAYDPKYDLNFDGCVNMSDMTELLPETK